VTSLSTKNFYNKIYFRSVECPYCTIRDSKGKTLALIMRVFQCKKCDVGKKNSLGRPLEAVEGEVGPRHIIRIYK